MTTSGPRQRTPRVAAGQRREEILVAANEVFGARGFHKASLGEIAERVGITHQGILHHFGSKEQLFVDVLAYRERLDVADFENHEPPHGPELLRHLVHTAVVNTGRIGLVQAYVVLSAESVTDGHPAQVSFRDRFTVLRGLIAAALEASLPTEPAAAGRRGRPRGIGDHCGHGRPPGSVAARPGRHRDAGDGRAGDRRNLGQVGKRRAVRDRAGLSGHPNQRDNNLVSATYLPVSKCA